MDKERIVYDLAMICVKQCLSNINPSDMDEACDLSVKAFENAYTKINSLIKPAVE